MHFVLLFLFGIAGTSGKGYNYPEVTTPLGTIRGQLDHLYNIPVKKFLSIPYAEPPVGDNRFRITIPVKPWNRTISGTQLPPACIQYSSNPFPWLDSMPDQKLDCLYLNVWTPYDAGYNNRKAVMFFIHGGGFRIGSSRLDYYDGAPLAALGNVVVVTFNFRLATEGFLDSGTREAPGNMGLYDILEALKFVHSHISHFGGDKRRVTLFGQSSGAIASGMLMASPLSRGLFARAIFQSGAPTNMDAEDNGRDYRLSEGVAKAVGCMAEDGMGLERDAESVVNCLRDKPALELSEAVSKVSDNPQRGLYPKFGDDILPENARVAFLEGNFKNMDILIGNVRNEGSTMITKANKETFGFFGHKVDHVNRTLGEQIIRNSFKNFPDVDKLVEHYLGKVPDDDEYEILQQVQMASGDYARLCPSVYLAERVSDKGNDVHYFFFTHRSSNSPWGPWMGVPHFEETPFVFGYPLRYPDNFTQDELQLSKEMIEIWTGFAKTGKQVSHPWPKYTRQRHIYRRLDTGIKVLGKGPHLENCDFLRPYFGF